MTREVYIVDGARTPFLKARGKPGPFLASDLATRAGQQLLLRQPFAADVLDEVILGCMIPTADEANIARMVALRLGCGKAMPAHTVQRNCASGMQALDSAFLNIAVGRHDLILAGGTEAMSYAPLIFNHQMVHWLASWGKAKTFRQRFGMFTKLRPTYFAPVIALLCGLTDPNIGMSMGQTAEQLAYDFGLTREQLDQYSVESHQRVSEAQDKGYFDAEIVNLYDQLGKLYADDDGVRRDSRVEKLATLKPFFDRKFGMVTPANSSQITDGAALLLLASRNAVERYQLPVLARLVDVQWAGLEPAVMGLGPVYASTQLLNRQALGRKDIDYWEINEAFAAQLLACLVAWQDEAFCKNELNLESTFGAIDRNRLNVDGGAIATGHPVGATGARIVLHLAHVLKRHHARYGVASLCIGGGQGGALLLENVEGVV